MENREPPDSIGGDAAAAQPTRGLGLSTAETRLVGLGRKEEWGRYCCREDLLYLYIKHSCGCKVTLYPSSLRGLMITSL